MRTLELTPRGVVGTLVVLVVAGACFGLGLWQLDRRTERLEHNQVVEARMSGEPIALNAAPMDTAGLTYRRAVVQGVVDDDRAIVLAGRSLNGAPGVYLLSPVRVGGGSILVNRGWLPAPDGATAELEPARMEGEVRAEGILMPFPDVDTGVEPGGFQVRWFRFDGGAIRRQFPYPVSPLYLRATSRTEALAGPDTAGVGAPIPLDPPALDAGPHLSYAIQWFSFGTIALVGWVILLLQRRREERGESARAQ